MLYVVILVYNLQAKQHLQNILALLRGRAPRSWRPITFDIMVSAGNYQIITFHHSVIDCLSLCDCRWELQAEQHVQDIGALCHGGLPELAAMAEGAAARQALGAGCLPEASASATAMFATCQAASIQVNAALAPTLGLPFL